MIDWNKLFSNSNVEKQVNILNDTLFSIFSKFARSKVITVDDRDPPWINEEIKCKIKSKNKTFQKYFKNGRKINFKEKTNLFDKYFSSQCYSLPNDCKLPENQIYITETRPSLYFKQNLSLNIFIRH